MKRVLESAHQGWLGAKENLIQGLVIIFCAALLVTSYYLYAPVREALEGLQAISKSWGLMFSMLTSAIGAGLIPGLYLMVVGKSRRDTRGYLDILFTCFVWATNMIWVDYFYRFQDWFWGPSATFGIVIAKMLLDQFVFTAFLSIHHVGIGFRLRDLNYDFAALRRALRDDWIIKVTIPMLVNCWLTWIPGTLVVYSLPLPLQIPLMVLIQCFFALEMAFVSSKMEISAQAI
ncbi:MAG: hypothetical protein U0X74_05120 [Anaerolineales bacterium]